jgi:hypothetical protein
MKLDAELGTGNRAAGCRGCGRVFNGDSLFDLHQRVSEAGTVCIDPETIGMVRKPTGRWSRKSDEANAARVIVLNERSRSEAAYGQPPVSLPTPDSSAA